MSLDEALRDMARTCPLPYEITALAERLDRMVALQATRRRGTRKVAVARKRG